MRFAYVGVGNAIDPVGDLGCPGTGQAAIDCGKAFYDSIMPFGITTDYTLASGETVLASSSATVEFVPRARQSFAFGCGSRWARGGPLEADEEHVITRWVRQVGQRRGASRYRRGSRRPTQCGAARGEPLIPSAARAGAGLFILHLLPVFFRRRRQLVHMLQYHAQSPNLLTAQRRPSSRHAGPADTVLNLPVRSSLLDRPRHRRSPFAVAVGTGPGAAGDAADPSPFAVPWQIAQWLCEQPDAGDKVCVSQHARVLGPVGASRSRASHRSEVFAAQCSSGRGGASAPAGIRPPRSTR